MKFKEIIPQLAKEGRVVISNGDVMIDKTLTGIIGGVPIYGITVTSNDFFGTSMTVNTMEELEEESTTVAGKAPIRKCAFCGEILNKDCLYDRGNDQYMCNDDCLLDWLNQTYGVDNWFESEDGPFGTKYMVRVDPMELQYLDEAVKKGDKWYKVCDVVNAMHFDNEFINEMQ